MFSGPPGFAIPKGFTVRDGTYLYTVRRDTVIPASWQTEPVYCLATTVGIWAVPAGTVNQLKTSVPESYQVTCNNLTIGLPGTDEQSSASYRAQVMQAVMFGVQGTPDCYRSALKKSGRRTGKSDLVSPGDVQKMDGRRRGGSL